MYSSKCILQIHSTVQILIINILDFMQVLRYEKTIFQYKLTLRIMQHWCPCDTRLYREFEKMRNHNWSKKSISDMMLIVQSPSWAQNNIWTKDRLWTIEITWIIDFLFNCGFSFFLNSWYVVKYLLHTHRNCIRQNKSL